ncbi:VanZ family protein [Furfurilactobacillus entadae]|uniref:VanZ family protein n=1 Tax=Furfurilactobacillus entadae TaxID=2922307 RepID=UPI0035EA1FDB
MWHQYLEPIHVAIVVFPLLALGLSLPLFIYHYHRDGAISRWQIAVSYSFFFYLLCAYFLIILPLPSRASVALLTTPKSNLHPLLVVQSLRATGFSLHNPATWIPTLHTAGFQQPFFNVMLTVPFGFYLHYYYKRNLLTTILCSFLLSLFFELTQLSGLYGLYVRPYRLFDVDDLILNTTGGLLGWLFAPLLTWLLPTREAINSANVNRAKTVGWLRRFTAGVVDWLIIGTFTVIGAIIISGTGHHPSLLLLVIINAGLVLYLPEWRFNGYTFGLRAVQLQVRSNNWRKPSWIQLALRQFLGTGSIILLGWLLAHSFDQTGRYVAQSSQLLFTILLAGCLIIDLLFAEIITGYPPFFERFSQTRLISLFDPAATAPHGSTHRSH